MVIYKNGITKIQNDIIRYRELIQQETQKQVPPQAKQEERPKWNCSICTYINDHFGNLCKMLSVIFLYILCNKNDMRLVPHICLI